VSLHQHSHRSNQIIQNGALNKMTDLILLKDWQKTTIELWRPVKDFPGYEVSNQGRLRSWWQVSGTGRIKDSVWHILTGGLDRGGYRGFILCRDGKPRVRRKLHRLVATTFLPPPIRVEQTTVNHKNNVSSDNRVDNLEWCTVHENNAHAKAIGMTPYGERNQGAKLESEQVLAIRASGSSNWHEYKQTGQLYGISDHQVFRIITRRSWAHL
jgi:hypothetical protein